MVQVGKEKDFFSPSLVQLVQYQLHQQDLERLERQIY